MKTREPQDLAIRTRQFGVAVIRLFMSLPRSTAAYVAGKQLLKSGTSVGAHFREARRAKSNADFVRKIEGALQELDETAYWLELMREAGLTESKEVDALHAEANELISIFVSVVKRVKTTSQSPA